MGRPRNRFACAAVTIHKSRECSDRLVADFGVRIGGQNLSEVRYNIVDANIPVTAPFASETMESALADGRHGIVQSAAKRVRRRVARVMIQKEQAEAPHRRIRMTECRHLHGGDGHLLAETPAAVLAEREQSVDEIIRDFEVGPHHFTQSGPTVSRSSIASLALRA